MLFPINSPVAYVALRAAFLVAVSKTCGSDFAAASNNCLPYLSDRYPSNDKNPSTLKYFLVLGSIE